MPLPFSEQSLLYILTSLECIEKINLYAKDFDKSTDFFYSNDQQPFNASCHLLLAIGEECGKIDETLKDEFSFVDWTNITGLHNRIAHDYRGIDFDIVFAICKNELSLLKDVLVKMIAIIKPPIDQLSELLQQPYFSHLGYLRLASESQSD